MSDDLSPAEPSGPLEPEGALEPPPGSRGAPDAMIEKLRRVTIGEYRVERELGRGGMASVYLGHDLSLDRKVAIKVMSPELFHGDRVFVDRFLREARTGARLNHPHIIPVYAIREASELIFFVMKFIDGKPIDDVIRHFGPLPIPLVVRVIAQVADALGYAHRNGIVHRDIKPGNMMLDKDGWVVLTDLGIAKVNEVSSLTATGSAIGTPTYMSPEQSSGSKATTGASDQYSLGCVAYEMLTGRPPFEADSVVALIFQHYAELPPPIHQQRPDCPAEVEAAVMRMLQKAPEDRFGSCDEVAQVFRDMTPGDEEEFRMLVQAFATGAGQTRAIKRINTPRTPTVPPSTPRPLSRPSQRELSVASSGMTPVPRLTGNAGPTPGSTGAMPSPAPDAAATAAALEAQRANWPRTLLRPPEQQVVKRRFQVPGVLTILVAVTLAWLLFFPRIGALETEVPTSTALMRAREAEAEAAVRRGSAPGADGSCEGPRADLAACRKQTPVAMSEIAPAVAEAVVFGVDTLFPLRLGNDWTAMRRAAGYPRDAFEWGNGIDRADLFAVLPGLLEQMEPVGRAGSLTQRLVQAVYFPADEGLFRKVREVLVARRVAKALPRERILEVYLNVAEFGPGLYGVEAAAQAYFRRSAKDLTRAQAATLAAVLATPRSSTPTVAPEAMRRRQALILRRLNGEPVAIPSDVAPADRPATTN